MGRRQGWDGGKGVEGKVVNEGVMGWVTDADGKGRSVMKAERGAAGKVMSFL